MIEIIQNHVVFVHRMYTVDKYRACVASEYFYSGAHRLVLNNFNTSLVLNTLDRPTVIKALS